MQAAKQLGSEAAKRNFLISPQRGEKKFLSELYELRNFREGHKKYKNSDRATECAMTCFGENLVKIDFAKITRHSEDNDILSPKNLVKELQEDLSLIAQDDEHVEMVKPSPEFVILTIVRKRLRPLTKREVGDFVIQDDLDIYNERKEK